MEGTIDAILQLWFFIGFIGSLVFYYLLRKHQKLWIIALAAFVVSGLLLFELLDSAKSAAAAALTMLLFGITVCSAGAMLLFNGWRYDKNKKSEL